MSRRSLLDRRSFLCVSAAWFAGFFLSKPASGQEKKLTQFQIACMTLPYSPFPLDRALTGIKSAGYKYVAWGTEHERTKDKPGIPVVAQDAPPEKAKELAKK